MSIPREGSRSIDKGILVSKYPDWCLTPIMPIPYTIHAKQNDDANTAPTVRQTGKRSHTKGSIITTCSGDEAGIGRGVKSGTKEDVCQPKTWSETVRFEGKNVVRHNDEWFMNNKNTTGKMTYVEDTEIYEPTTQLINNDQDRYCIQADLNETQASFNETSITSASLYPEKEKTLLFDQSYQVTQATVAPGPLPLYIPPVAIPGSKENQEFVKAGNEALNKVGDVVSEGKKKFELFTIIGMASIMTAYMSLSNIRVTSSIKTETNDNNCKKTIVISYNSSPEAAQHIMDAQGMGYPSTLTLDRTGAAARRRAAIKNTPTALFKDRDEYPPAAFLEGGAGASVRLISASDNRSAGAQMGSQLRGVPNGCKITIFTGP